MTAHCFRCDAPLDGSQRTYCRACHNANQREWRKKYVRIPRETYEAMQAALVVKSTRLLKQAVKRAVRA